MKREENHLYIKFDPDWKVWGVFAKYKGHAFILDGYESEGEAIVQSSRVLYALNKYGEKEYKNHDFEDDEFNTYPLYPVTKE